MVMAHVWCLYRENKGISLKSLFYIGLANTISIIISYTLLHHCLSLLLTIFGDFITLVVPLYKGINIFSHENINTGDNTGLPPSSNTGNNSGVGESIPITKDENSNLIQYLKDLKSTVTSYLVFKNRRDVYK